MKIVAAKLLLMANVGNVNHRAIHVIERLTFVQLVKMNLSSKRPLMSIIAQIGMRPTIILI